MTGVPEPPIMGVSGPSDRVPARRAGGARVPGQPARTGGRVPSLDGEGADDATRRG